MPTRTATPPAKDELLDALLSATRAMVAIAARSLAEADPDVTLPQYRTLIVLAYRGPQRGVDIAAELGVNPSTGTRMSERLVRKGLVRRQRPASNRREVRLTLTPDGRALVRRVTEYRRAELTRIVGGWPKSWHAPLTSALRALTAAAGELPEDQWWLGWTRPDAAEA